MAFPCQPTHALKIAQSEERHPLGILSRRNLNQSLKGKQYHLPCLQVSTRAEKKKKKNAHSPWLLLSSAS